MDAFMTMALILLILQSVISVILYERWERYIMLWMRRKALIVPKPLKIKKETPREILNRLSIKPLDISNIRALITDDYGQLCSCPSVLYHVADMYAKAQEEKIQQAKMSQQVEGDYGKILPTDQKKLRLEMERHANKLRRRCELETYNARRANFKRFAIDRMSGNGRHRYTVDPATLNER
ncbi:hypothetical protein Q1695_004017 [Nippostrongylus brasiliensis]|nr:hypothetical protein Q1695_004017 [Nippostrongylus brasiliensis]